MENPIEMLASKLQQLPSEVRWLFTAQNVVLACARGLEPERGPWERFGRRLIGIAAHFGFERVVSVTANVILLAGAYFSQFRVPVDHAWSGPLFIGIQALREPELVRQFAELQGRPVVQIDERRLTNFSQRGRVPLRALLAVLISLWGETWPYLSRSAGFGPISRFDAINVLLIRGHRYAYLRAWFRAYLRAPGAVSTIAFSAASSVSFAAVAAGARAVYMLHGLQRHSLIYPEFAQCFCFTGFEAAHVRRRLPRCEVLLRSEPVCRIETARIVAIAGTYELTDADLIRPVIDWARRSELPVVVRRHPADETGYWEQWRNVEGVQILEGGGSFSQFLEQVRPRFLACWYSTALLDALLSGIVPLTVTPAAGEALDIVFPIREISLCWPEDEELAGQLMDDASLRTAFIAKKIDYVLNCRSSQACDKEMVQTVCTT